MKVINPRKTITSNIIPQKLLKYTKNISFETLRTIINNYLIKAEFPNELKLTDVTPVF